MDFIIFQIKKLIKIIRNEVLVLPSRVIVGLFFIILIGLPFVTQDPYIIRIVILTSIFAVLAASWDLLSGYTGQMNFGHALFFGVGAYASAIFNIHFHLPPWLTVPMGAVVAVLAGLIVGIPCLRLKRTYLALTTLAFPIILLGVIIAMPDVTGGELGMSGVERFTNSLFGNYYLHVISFIILAVVMWKITDSNTGIIFHAIREDELAVKASGVNTVFYKLLAFSLSGFFAGIAGGLYAHYMRIAGPSTLEVNMSFTVVIWAIFGGAATIYGPIAAVFILFPLLEVFRIWPEYRMMIFAAVVLIILLYMPEGFIHWARDKIEKECPRCKVRNVATRKSCRICTANLD